MNPLELRDLNIPERRDLRRECLAVDGVRAELRATGVTRGAIKRWLREGGTLS